MHKHLKKIIFLCIVLLMATWSCSSVRMTTTDRSILEQQLMVQGIERALDGFDLTDFYGKRVNLAVSGLSEDEVAFTKDYLQVHLGKHGLQVVTDQSDVELKMRVLAPVLAVDQSETLLGTPAFTFLGIPIPAISAALSYYDGYRSERLPHNLLQAQRDYFGAHTYERIDREGNFHSDWLGLRREPEV